MENSLDTFFGKLSFWAASYSSIKNKKIVKEAKFSTLDTWACMVSGSNSQQSSLAIDATNHMREIGEVYPVGSNERLSLLSATLINGIRAHSIDFDDYEVAGQTHVSGPIFSALFSLSQLVPLTIDDILKAWVVGYEVAVRIGQALGYDHYNKGWHSTSTIGPISVSASVSKALRLTSNQMQNAMSIATSSSAGLKKQFGFSTKALHCGLAAQRGLQAAFFAKSNFTGNHLLWEGFQGFVEIYGTTNSFGFKNLLSNIRLGEASIEFPVARKLWPSCGYTHRAIWGGKKIFKKLTRGENIKEASLSMPEPYYRIANFLNPKTDAEARFSIAYCLATTLIRGTITPDDFYKESFSNPEINELAKKIIFDLYELPKEIPFNLSTLTPEKLVIETTNGRTLEQEVTRTPGSQAMPLTEKQLLGKITECSCSVNKAKDFLKAANEMPFRNFSLF